LEARGSSAQGGGSGVNADAIWNTLHAHLPELRQFALDPETGLKDQILHYGELLWSSLVRKTAHVAFDLGIDNIPDSLARLFPPSLGLSRSEWERARRQIPSLAPFLEPYPLSARGILWQGGFTWGLVQGVAEMIPPLTPMGMVMHGIHQIQALNNAFWALYKALKEKGFAKLISEAWKATRNRFFNFFEDAVHKSAFDQGKLTGTIVANVVATILLILSVIGVIGDLASLVRIFRTSGFAGELLEAFGRGGAGAAEKVLCVANLVVW